MPPCAMRKRSSTRQDINTTAFSVVQKAIGQAEAASEKNPAAVALGRLGGLKGGVARAKSLTTEQRKEIAKRAAKSRWSR